MGARLGGLFVMGCMGAPIAPLCMRAIGFAARVKAPAVEVANVALAGVVSTDIDADVVSSAADADEPSAGRPPPARAPPAEAISMSKMPEAADADRLKLDPAAWCCWCCCCCCCCCSA